MISRLTEEQAKAYHSLAYKYKPFIVYRKLSNGDWRAVGKVYWSLNYSAMPFKQKYWPLMYLSMNEVKK